MGVIDIEKLQLTKDQEIIYKESMASIKKYRQAAIHLHTGGGKTYILAKILSDLYKKTKKENFNVVYASKPASCDRVKSAFDNQYWKSFVSFLSFSLLQIDENAIKRIGLDGKNKVDVFVIDEAHGALAPETYIGISNIIKNNNKAIIIAMTANDKRNDSRKYIFDWLTPKLTVGVDYRDRGLAWAVKNNKLCGFTYKNANLEKLITYYKTLTLLHDRLNLNSNKRDELLKSANNVLSEYRLHAYKKLAISLKEDLVRLNYDGSDGDRWFVFFNTIDELQSAKKDVRAMFKKAYEDYDVKIHVIEFHNKEKNVEQALSVLSDKATPNNVDIILTCKKGGESFHPEHTRGIIMNRRSKSEIDVTQMLGRTLEVKELNNSPRIIYDLVDNRETLDITSTNSYKQRAMDDGQLSLFLNRVIDNNNKYDVVDCLQDRYEDNISIEDLDSDVTDLISSFDDMLNKEAKLLDAKIISEILDIRGGQYIEQVHPYKILRDFDNETNKKGIKILDKFKDLQKLFIQGYFGEYTILEENKQSEEYTKIYKLLGDNLFMTIEQDKDTKYTIKELKDIAKEVKFYGYDYRNRISHTSDLKRKISELRMLNIDNKLSKAAQAYCYRNLIDIDGLYIDLIQTILTSNEANDNKEITKEFRAIAKEFNRYGDIVYDEEYTDTEVVEEATECLSRLHIFSLMNRTEFAKQATTALRITYKELISLALDIVGKDDYTNATDDILGVRRVRAMSDKIDKVSKYCLTFGDKYENFLMMLAKRNEENKIGNYEKVVLDKLGVKAIRDNREASIRKLLDSTPFGIAYNDFIENNSMASYNKLQQYDKICIPEYYNKLINKRAFKQSKTEMGAHELLSKDNNKVKEIISQLFYIDDDKVDEVKKAVNNKEIDPRKLLVYCFSDNTYKYNKKFIDDILEKNFIELDNTEMTKLNVMIKSDALSCGCILENLMECNLIPDSQYNLARYIIKKAEQY